MKKFKFFGIASALLVYVITGCHREAGVKMEKPTPEVAYLSIEVEMKGRTRASSEENDTAEENVLHKLYLVTFDETGNVLAVPGTHAYYVMIDENAEPDTYNPQAIKVSGAAKNLVVIANPGPALVGRLNTLTAGSSFATLNAAIAGIDIGEITDGTRGFAMITGGDETGKTATPPNNVIANPYVDISDKIVLVTTTEADAKTAAEQMINRVPVKLERLAAKLSVSVAEPLSKLKVQPHGARFSFEGWTVDGVNTTCFPFAEKTIISTAHSSTLGSYVNNFYTKDPNYDDQSTPHSGLIFGTVNGSGGSYAPVLPWNGLYGWENASTSADPVCVYVTENTMAAAAQKYGNATRLVIRGTYTPSGFTEGADWFRWAGVNYPSLEALQMAYTAPDAGQALRDACDDFYYKIEVYYANHPELDNMSANNFATLLQEDLDRVAYGGQAVRSDHSPVIRWHQKGLSYYTYEIRHDNEADGMLAFGKYGVVRNNFYRLTLNSVSGAGTPWYPEPGDNGHQGGDPIDQTAGYLGISVSVGEWILWETNFGI